MTLLPRRGARIGVRHCILLECQPGFAEICCGGAQRGDEPDRLLWSGTAAGGDDVG